MNFTVQSNIALTKDVYKMVLEGDTSGTRAGQFVEVLLEGHFLRRPISVADWSDKTLTLIYKVVGVGTSDMSKIEIGKSLDILTALGNGYELELAGTNPLLIGGGVGVPPTYALAKRLTEKGIKPTVIMGFNTKSEVFYEEEFKALGCTVFVATADGTYGTKGFVTNVITDKEITPTHYYTCGPLAMIKAVEAGTSADGQASFEERMGCGFGACMGCTIITTNGAKRVCKDGPVFKKGEVLW